MSRNVSTSLLLGMLTILFITACQPIHSAEKQQISSLQLSLQPPSTIEHKASQIFAAISPAVAFIDTPTGTGSGVLIHGSYLLSNAHVVWPFDKVRVVFPDGSEFLDAPVVKWDLMADLALIGPIDTTIQPVALVDGSDIEIGSDVYLIGYPAEVEKFPQPTITNGILSRIRKWNEINYRFFQVDATITGGQSGGVLVTQHGDVIGVSTFYYDQFGLAGSVADTIFRLNTMLGNPSDIKLDDRSFATGKGSEKQLGELINKGDVRRYVLMAPIDTTVNLHITGTNGLELNVLDILGSSVQNSTGKGNPQKHDLNFTVEYPIPYVVEVLQSLDSAASFKLESSVPLVPYLDPDDNTLLTIGDTHIGNLDISTDQDRYELQLKTGDTIDVRVDSLEFDPFIILHYDSPSLQEDVSDDNSGGGIFGESAQFIYKAPRDGRYELVVSGDGYSTIGGYFLSVAKAPPEAKLTKLDFSRPLIASEFGRLAWYEDPKYGFAMRYPVDWAIDSTSNCGKTAIRCLTSNLGLLSIRELDISQLDEEDRTQEGYIANFKKNLEKNNEVSIVSLEKVKTLQGLSANKIIYTSQSGRFTIMSLVYVDQNDLVAFFGTYVVRAELFADFKRPAEELLFDSFRQWSNIDKSKSAVFHLDEAMRLSASGAYTEALTEYSKSLEIDPNLNVVFRERPSIYVFLHRLDDAITELNIWIKSNPQDDGSYTERAHIFWIADRPEDALKDINHAIQLNPDKKGNFNTRALILTTLGKFNEALKDMEHYAELNKGKLPPAVLDTRAFVYLSMGDYAKAKADYDEAIAQNFSSFYVLLGKGIAAAELGKKDEAIQMLVEGIQKFEQAKLVLQNPQATDLLERANQWLTKLEVQK